MWLSTRTSGLLPAPAACRPFSTASVTSAIDSRSKGVLGSTTLYLSAKPAHRPGCAVTCRRTVSVRAAVMSRDAAADEVSEATLSFGTNSVKVTVTANSAEQHIRMETRATTKMLLHWGLEGGKDYKGGWRLPEEGARPPNSVQYKDRALQTRFLQEGALQTLEIVLAGDEMSDNLNFVFKEDGGDRWYDCNGTNFVVSLHPMEAITKMTMSGKPAPEGPLPELSNELCGIWAYIKWEEAGCPNRSQEESDREYRAGIIEMQEFLQQGITIDELWKVAKGEIPYPEFMRSIGSLDTMDVDVPAPEAPVPEAPAEEDVPEADVQAEILEASVAEAEQAEALPTLPHDLIISRAYMMWVEDGRPMGANFDDAARKSLEQELKEGRTVESLIEEVFSAKQAQDKIDEERNAEEAAKREAEEAERRKEAEARAKEEEKQAKEEEKQAKKMPQPMKDLSSVGSQEMGEAFVHQQNRNPMDFIKDSDVPLLSADKDKKQVSALEPLVQDAALDDTVVYRRSFPMGNQAGLLAVVRQTEGEEVVIDLTTDIADEVVLHWGVSPVGDNNGWVQPEKELLPDEDSIRIKNGIAAETPFTGCDEDECDIEVGGYKVPLQRVKILLPANHGLAALQFVVRSEDSTRWWKDGNGNFKVRVPGSGQAMVSSVDEDFVDNEVAKQIVKSESSSAWTLMHRYNKVADLLDGLTSGQFPDADPMDATAHLYVWLRYSTNRHITWQRNYNTQPRILSAAQDRLTQTIARTHKVTAGEAQEWVRLMLGMLGRGGDGQKIRDEILNIMHRNNIKEVKGTWMEEWHQKLHNNTTPDDVGICEAYLAYLRANGDNGAYWRVLSDHGISRSRLEGFDRSIRCEPEDYPHMRGTLIGEFENYLSILKAVHSGTDLQTSAQAAAYCTPEPAKGFLGYVLSNRHGQVVPLLEAAVEARTEIRKAAVGNRELMYLDLALEDVIRGGAERAAGASPNNAIRLVGPLLQNLCLTAGDNEEICFCLAAWLALPEDLRQGHHPSREAALQAAAVVDRTRIALANISDTVSNRIEPIATALGNSFGVEEWATVLFAEEVVRGGPAFAVSQVLGNIEAGLRAAAELGAWQVISPGGSTGRIRVEHDLYKIQDDVYEEPTVLVIDRVTGEEEIPEGTVAVLTPDAPDVLSHVSVRARNMHVLFATCHDDGPLHELRNMNGRIVEVKTSAAGEVTWTEEDDSALSEDNHESNSAPKGSLKINVPKWVGKYAVGMDEFKDGVVGAKSKNISGLRGKLPDWINLPASVTIPFGSFEKALDEPECKEVKKQLEEAVKRIKDSPAEVLQECRDIIMGMTVPEVLKTQLSSEMKAAKMEWPDGKERWDEALEALKGVWASKFNERAYISMRKAGLPFMDLRMAVLVMRVVPAKYAFVIHTMNPSTRDTNEVYCELVTGLGETLVSGQFPGKSMAFSASKDDPDNPRVLSYPSKSAAMFVPESLIFRSDSNGEDLDGYAGAGLYDSITMDPCVTKRVDYTGDRLSTDEDFRRHILSQICKVGIAIEEALGDAQDVEGVVDPDGNIFVVQTRPQV